MYSCLENPMDRGAWQATVHGVTRVGQDLASKLLLTTDTRDSLLAQSVKNLPAMPETWVQFLGQEEPLEKEMATHSNILAWEIPWTEEPGGLWSIGSQTASVRQRLKLLHAHAFIYMYI